MKSELIGVMVCVNNTRNGAFSGRLAGVDIHEFMDLEPVVLPEPRCAFKGGGFRVHRRKFLYHGHQNWVGNWCWDCIGMTPVATAAFIAHLLSQRFEIQGEQRPVWSIDVAHGLEAIAIANRHQRNEPITEVMIRDALIAAMQVVKEA